VKMGFSNREFDARTVVRTFAAESVGVSTLQEIDLCP
jgi:hypothetical protein